MRVLSLFDGMGCGIIALRELGIYPEVYYASEVDKHAIKQTRLNFPDIIHLGDVKQIDVFKLGRIDLLIGGSPCQSFSMAGKMNGMSTKFNEDVVTLDRYLELKSQNSEFEGESYLFWEYVRILTELRKTNPYILFFLENVRMQQQWEKVIDDALGIKGAHINSRLVSAQNRERIYWSNIKTTRYGLFQDDLYTYIPRPADRGLFLKDILDKDVDSKYYISDNMLEWLKKHSKKKNTKINIMSGNEKSHCVTSTAILKGNLTTDYVPVIVDGKECLRKYTPSECARLQTIPGWYKWDCSDTQQYRMLGNGWTVEIIKHIFSFIKLENNKMKELEVSFDGIGEVKGYSFKQLFKSDSAYIYEKTHIESGTKSYEVFKRVENTQFNCVSYPKSKSFGVWAYECATIERAKEYFDKFNDKKKDESLNIDE